MPNYYDPVRAKILQAQAKLLYVPPRLHYNTVLGNLNPTNWSIRIPGSFTAQKASKIIRKLTKGRGPANHKALEQQVKQGSWSEANKPGPNDPSNLEALEQQVKQGPWSEANKEGPNDPANLEALEQQVKQGPWGDQYKDSPLAPDKLAQLENSLTPEYLKHASGLTNIKIYLSARTSKNLSEPYLTIPFIPQTVNIASNANFAKINILNRNNTPYQFINGSNTITFTIDWYSTGRNLGKAFVDAKKLQLLTQMDGRSFPPLIILEWGSNEPLFEGYLFVVKEAKMQLGQFHRTSVERSAAGQTIHREGVVLPARVRQDVTLVRIDKPTYQTIQSEMDNLPKYG